MRGDRGPIDLGGEAHDAVERAVRPLREHRSDALFDRLANACDEQVLPLERELQVLLGDARDFHTQLQRAAEVEQVGARSGRVGSDVARAQGVDPVAYGDELVEVGGGAEALDIHAAESSIVAPDARCARPGERPRYPAPVRVATPRIPVLAAPTAAGKTAAAFALARASRARIEVVSADAMQVYCGLDIGTAKPSADERRRLSHHLIDVVEPTAGFSVAAYVRLAEGAIADVLERGALPLVVGGTGLYLRALEEGLPGTPPADRERQAEIEAEMNERGLDALVAELHRASPSDAARAGRNPRRIVRALEVLRATGRPASMHGRRPPRFRYRTAVLLPGAAVLEGRIRERAREMIARGWLDEVVRLAPSMPQWATAAQAIGYDELRRHLEGAWSLDRALERIDGATLRYAKRQRTWFRRTPSDATRWHAPAEGHLDDLLRWLEHDGAADGAEAPHA